MKIFGVILLVFGIICFAIPSITFFTTERVVDTGFFHLDVSKPHTILLNPGVGILMAVVGLVVIMLAQKSKVSA